MLATKCEISVYLMAFYWCLLYTPSISILYIPHPTSLLSPSTSILHIHLLYSPPPPPPPPSSSSPSILYSIQQSSSSIPSTPPPPPPLAHLSSIPSNNPLHQFHLNPPVSSSPSPSILYSIQQSSSSILSTPPPPFPLPICPIFHPTILFINPI